MLYSKNKLQEISKIKLNNLEDSFLQLGHEVEEVKKMEYSGFVVGEILKIEKHPNADNLNVVLVDIKKEQLQIVCGAKNLVLNSKVIVATLGTKVGDLEIKKVKLRGVESCGMLCALEEICFDRKIINPENNPYIYIFDQEVNIGSDACEVLGLNDEIYDLSLTANRGDCLSYIGMLRDVYPLYNQELLMELNIKEKIKELLEEINHPQINVEVITGVNNLKYLLIKEPLKLITPNWLKIFLAKHEMISHNYILDLLDYLMLIFGIPMHCYDYDKINGKITIKRSENDNTFVGIDQKEYNVKKDDLIIIDEEKIISLPTILGSNETKYDVENTKNILIEIGSFDQNLIRFTNNNKKIKTLASMRGEKGIDPHMVEIVCYYLQQILEQDGFDVEQVFQFKTEKKEKTIKYKPSKAKVVLGIEIEESEQINILENLGFKLHVNSDFYEVTIPSYRFDIENDHDLFEEIIRIKGLDVIEINDEMYTNISNKNISTEKINLTQKIETEMLKEQMTQIISYSLIDEKQIKEFHQEENKAIKLMMPLSQQHVYYRQSLLPSLFEICQRNYNNQARTINYYEIGNIYQKENDKIIEEEKIAFILSGVKEQNIYQKEEFYDFYDLKEIIIKLFKILNITNYQFISSDRYQEFNKYAQAEILVNDEVVGVIGIKNPEYLKKVKAYKNAQIVACELNLTKLNNKNNVKRYIKYNKLPIIKEVITINVLKDDACYEQIINVFNDHKLQYLTKYNLINIYEKEEYLAYSFELGFEQKEQLAQEDIDQERKIIIENIKNNGYKFIE